MGGVPNPEDIAEVQRLTANRARERQRIMAASEQVLAEENNAEESDNPIIAQPNWDAMLADDRAAAAVRAQREAVANMIDISQPMIERIAGDLRVLSATLRSDIVRNPEPSHALLLAVVSVHQSLGELIPTLQREAQGSSSEVAPPPPPHNS